MMMKKLAGALITALCPCRCVIIQVMVTVLLSGNTMYGMEIQIQSKSTGLQRGLTLQ